MKLKIKKFNKSKYDLKLNVTFPSELSEELAEFIGIMIGDGHLSVIERSNELVKRFTQSTIFISGCNEETEYLNYISDIFKRLFNCELSLRQDKRSKAVLLTKYSMGVVQYLNVICRIPIGRKTNTVGVPKIIKIASKKIQCAFLRGLADTDYYVRFKKSGKKYSYPSIRGCFKSKKLIQDLEGIYQNRGFKYSCCYDQKRFDKRWGEYKMQAIYLYGKENLDRWMNLVGFSNPKNSERIKLFRKTGECLPMKKRAPGGI